LRPQGRPKLPRLLRLQDPSVKSAPLSSPTALEPRPLHSCTTTPWPTAGFAIVERQAQPQRQGGQCDGHHKLCSQEERED
jgi:hypothetical protein